MCVQIVLDEIDLGYNCTSAFCEKHPFTKDVDFGYYSLEKWWNSCSWCQSECSNDPECVAFECVDKSTLTPMQYLDVLHSDNKCIWWRKDTCKMSNTTTMLGKTYKTCWKYSQTSIQLKS